MPRPLGYKASSATRAKQAAAMAGKTHTPETRAKISAALVGLKRGPSSDEHKRNQRIAMLRKQEAARSE